MFIVEDPLLALILRFVVDTSKGGGSNEEFLNLQIQTLKKYLARFPDQEQGMRAMEWIEQRAQRYRQDWERRTVSHRTLCLRCADCPLADRGVEEHCEIHEQWLFLLRRYTSGTGVAAEFVEGALRLLQAHKDKLKARTQAPGAMTVPMAPVATSARPPETQKAKGGGGKGDSKAGKASDKAKGKRKGAQSQGIDPHGPAPTHKTPVGNGGQARAKKRQPGRP